MNEAKPNKPKATQLDGPRQRQRYLPPFKTETIVRWTASGGDVQQLKICFVDGTPIGHRNREGGLNRA